MPQLTLNILSAKKTSQVFSPKDLRENFLAGIPLEKLDQIPESTFDFYISSAQEQVENYLNLKLGKTIIEEEKDFNRDDWVNWNFIKTSYPCVHPLTLDGYLGATKQVNYPSSWISSRKTNDGKLYSREIYLVPTQNAAHNEVIVYSGIMPNAGFFNGSRAIPDYWTIKYITGFDTVPNDIIQAIGMIAAIQILGIVSDMYIGGSKMGGGLGFGVSSKSISIDGLSQSVSGYANGQTGVFGARIKMYGDQLLHPEKGLLKQLIEYYGTFIMGVA